MTEVDPTDALPEALGPLLESFQAGKKTALARAISLIENEGPGFQGFLHRVLAAGPRAGRRPAARQASGSAEPGTVRVQ